MKKIIKCKYCNSTNLFTYPSGLHTGLYCTDCGKWQKWLGKAELKLVKKQINKK